MHDLAAECECESWGVAAVDWGEGGPHPRSWNASDVTPALISRLRGDPAACNARAAQHSTWALFLHQQAALRGPPEQVCAQLQQAPPFGYAPLNASSCHLTARKFPAATSRAVEELVSNCSSGSSTTGGSSSGSSSSSGSAGLYLLPPGSAGH